MVTIQNTEFIFVVQISMLNVIYQEIVKFLLEIKLLHESRWIMQSWRLYASGLGLCFWSAKCLERFIYANEHSVLNHLFCWAASSLNDVIQWASLIHITSHNFLLQLSKQNRETVVFLIFSTLFNFYEIKQSLYTNSWREENGYGR
jgi:hypothetical protein